MCLITLSDTNFQLGFNNGFALYISSMIICRKNSENVLLMQNIMEKVETDQIVEIPEEFNRYSLPFSSIVSHSHCTLANRPSLLTRLVILQYIEIIVKINIAILDEQDTKI